MIVDAGDPARRVGADRVEHRAVEHAGRDDDVGRVLAQLGRDGARRVGVGAPVFVGPRDRARRHAVAEASAWCEVARQETDRDPSGCEGRQHRLPIALCAADITDCGRRAP